MFFCLDIVYFFPFLFLFFPAWTNASIMYFFMYLRLYVYFWHIFCCTTHSATVTVPYCHNLQCLTKVWKGNNVKHMITQPPRRYIIIIVLYRVQTQTIDSPPSPSVDWIVMTIVQWMAIDHAYCLLFQLSCHVLTRMTTSIGSEVCIVDAHYFNRIQKHFLYRCESWPHPSPNNLS